MARAIDKVVEALRARPSRTAVLLDFDGTLAPIVEDPLAARPLPGVPEVLARLAGEYGTVAVVSGRPVAFLQEHLAPGPTLIGLYGLERVEEGEVVEVAAARPWRPVVAEAVAAAAIELPAAVTVEDKGLSLTLHVRRSPGSARTVDAWARQAEERWGLERRPARRSVELHPPLLVDKGTVVTSLLTDHDAACFIGDDVGDLPAFAAVERFGRMGGTGHRIVVSSTEMAGELVAAADLVVPDQAAVLSLLEALLPHTEPPSELIG